MQFDVIQSGLKTHYTVRYNPQSSYFQIADSTKLRTFLAFWERTQVKNVIFSPTKAPLVEAAPLRFPAKTHFKDILCGKWEIALFNN